MANHKRRRPANRRRGCKLCKPWKINGARTERADGEKFSDHVRRESAAIEIDGWLVASASMFGDWDSEEDQVYGEISETARSFRISWQQAMNGETYPIEELWDGIDG